MLSITSYTKAGLRLATIFGSICSAVSILVAVVYLVMKLLYWDRFAAGMAPLLIGMCFLGSVQIFFIGMVGEYVLSINQRIMKRPLVVEEERLNFGNSHSGRKKNQSRTGENGRKTGKGEPGAMKREPEDNKEDSGRGRQKETRQNEPQIKKQQQKEAPQKSTEAMKEEGAHTKRRHRRKKSEGSKLNAPEQEE